MYSAVSFLQAYIQYGEISIDNWVFRLHRQLTFVLLFSFSVFVSTKEVFGDPIDCFTTTKDDLPDNILDNYCWIQSTFSLPGALNKRVGVDVIYPGIDTRTDPQYSEAPRYHSYYQWVCFFLLLEAFMFYLPYYMWRIFDGGKIKRLVQVTKLADPIADCPEAVKEANNGKMGTYYFDTMGHNNGYALKFLMCECLNFVNVVGQIYFANAFLGGEFADFGLDIIKYSQMDQINRTDPMITLFPRVTKCEMQKVGVAGSIQRHDALCVLPVNMINEKIFIFLWFWFVILSVITGTFLLFRFSLFVRKVRYTDLRFECSNEKGLLPDLQLVVEEGGYGDWFVLDLLRKNISSIHFGSLIKEIARHIKMHKNKEEMSVQSKKHMQEGDKMELQPLNVTFQSKEKADQSICMLDSA